MTSLVFEPLPAPQNEVVNKKNPGVHRDPRSVWSAVARLRLIAIIMDVYAETKRNVPD